jgi:puromycin-sensitive aminopeptidase
VSHLNSPYRLTRTVLPSRYQVSLVPDLDNASFTGSATISADAVETASEIVLNAIELQIHSVSVNGEDATYSLNEDLERLIINTSVTPGALTIDITFTGILNDKLRGFYRSTFVDDSGVTRTIATTQMQSTDCRRAFPCFDEPDFKAVFAIDLTFASDLMAVSNSREVRREDLGNGTTRAWFADTMVMSTYLVAFVVGPLEATDTVMVGDVALRLIHVPGKSHLTEFGLRIGAFALDWFQNYYGIPYPGDKCDLLALPDFAAGAMENLGCITFREVLLLVDPATSTQVEQELVAAVVAHELAHMWFGDLVTMRWWNGIWLNEAFATFMEVAAADAFAPQWKMWTSFGLDRSAAFDVDSLHSTRTVEFPVESPADADGMFDVLTYQKGGALLRMLEQYLGPDRFRAGVSHYLTKHSYGNTETNDLWDAIEHVVSTDGGEMVPVRQLMDSWIWQAGYPLVSARVDGNDLVLAQRQFTFDNNPDATIWVVPVHVRIGNDTQKLLLEGDDIRISMKNPDDVVVVNAGGSGFFRVEYSADLMSRISGETLRTLTTLERYNLVDDAWNAVVAGAVSADRFMAFAQNFTEETDLAVWQALNKGLVGLGRMLNRDEMAPYNASIRALVSPAYSILGANPVDGEPDLTAKLRGLLLSTLAVLGGDESAQKRCRAILFNNATTEPELVAAATNVVAATGDAQDYEWFLGRFKDPSTPQDRIRMLYALAEFDDADLMQRTCDLAFSDEVKSQDAPFLITRAIANKYHGDIAWAAAQKNWAYANEKFPGNTIVRMVSSVTTLNTPAHETQMASFFSEHPIPQAVKTLEQVLERQRINVALRSREASTLKSALQS